MPTPIEPLSLKIKDGRQRERERERERGGGCFALSAPPLFF